MRYNIDFVGLFPTIFKVSGALVVISLVLFLGKGLSFGIDFNGGTIMHLRFEQAVAEDVLHGMFKKVTVPGFEPEKVVVQPVADDLGVKTAGATSREYIIQYPIIGSPEKLDELNKQVAETLRGAAPVKFEVLDETSVGPTIGREMKRDSFYAAIISIIGILFYMGWRFELNSSLGAVIALVHDAIITLGFLIVVQQEFDVTVLAGVLTLLGFSINDSIVVLDRIRENKKLVRGETLANIVNMSINQTLGRTINTSMTVLFTLLALLLLGGPTLHGFAVVLTFGITIGTYSSVAIASPVMLWLSEREKESKKKSRSMGS